MVLCATLSTDDSEKQLDFTKNVHMVLEMSIFCTATILKRYTYLNNKKKAEELETFMANMF